MSVHPAMPYGTAEWHRSQRATLGVTTAPCTTTVTGNIYVTPSGSDGASCAQSAPCSSLGRAYQAAAPGQRIVVAPGSYPDQLLSYDPTKDAWRVPKPDLQGDRPPGLPYPSD